MEPYSVRCPACGATLGAGAAYCPSCGTPRAAAPTPPAAQVETPSTAASLPEVDEAPVIAQAAEAAEAPVAESQPAFEPVLTAHQEPEESPSQPQPAPAEPEAPGGYPPPPPPSATPPPVYPGLVTAAQVKQAPSTGPVILEVILGLFGIFGVGWIWAGKTAVGVILLGLSVLWWGAAAFVAVHTVFVGCCGIIPLNLVFVALSASRLRSEIQRG